MTSTNSLRDEKPLSVHSAPQRVCSSLKTGKKFPQKIAVAVLAITTGDIYPELSRSARNVFSFIVRLVDIAKPTDATWAFKTTIASRVGISEATVYRCLTELVEANLIERLTQDRKTMNGRLHCSRIRLTIRALKELRLISHRVEDPTSEGAIAGHVVLIGKEEPVKADSAISIGNTKNVEHPTLDPVGPDETDILGHDGAATDPTKIDDKIGLTPSLNLKGRHILPCRRQTTGRSPLHGNIRSPSSNKTRHALPKPAQPFYALPSEFFWLVEGGKLTPSQVFLLMRLFSNRGQRLSDAVYVLRPTIEQLPRAKVFAYLRKVAVSPTDFRWLAKEKTQQRVETDKKRTVETFRKALINDKQG